ncbi:MAG: hypothetical protein ACXWC9_08465 [Pseudobdellovibrionaceae bacterium]
MPTMAKLGIKGQATIEALVASVSVIGFMVLLLAIFYFLSLKAHLQFTSHELLVCREFRDPVVCDFNFQKDLRSFLSFGRIESIQAQRNSNSHSMVLKLGFKVLGFQRFQWIYKDQISLPLRKS